MQMFQHASWGQILIHASIRCQCIDAMQFDLKEEVGIWRNRAHAWLTISHSSWNSQNSSLSKAHVSYGHFPTTNDLRGSKLKAEEVAILRGIEHLTIVQVACRINKDIVTVLGKGLAIPSLHLFQHKAPPSRYMAGANDILGIKARWSLSSFLVSSIEFLDGCWFGVSSMPSRVSSSRPPCCTFSRISGLKNFLQCLWVANQISKLRINCKQLLHHGILLHDLRQDFFVGSDVLYLLLNCLIGQLLLQLWIHISSKIINTDFPHVVQSLRLHGCTSQSLKDAAPCLHTRWHGFVGSMNQVSQAEALWLGINNPLLSVYNRDTWWWPCCQRSNHCNHAKHHSCQEHHGAQDLGRGSRNWKWICCSWAQGKNIKVSGFSAHISSLCLWPTERTWMNRRELKCSEMNLVTKVWQTSPVLALSVFKHDISWRHILKMLSPSFPISRSNTKQQ